MNKSTRKLVHLKITPSTVLQVLIFVTSDKIDYTTELHSKIVRSLFEAIQSHLTIIGGKLVTKKQRDLETSRSIHHPGEFYLTYYFKWQEKHQSILVRENLSSRSDEKTVYKPMTIYPYQLLVHIDEPQKEDTLYTYFSTAPLTS